MPDDTALQGGQQADKPVVAEPENTKPEDNKPNGYDEVDFNEFPDEIRQKIEPRFHRIYGQMKRNENANKELIENQRRIYEKLEGWENGLKGQETATRVNQLKAEWKEAFRLGDAAKAWSINEEMTNLKVAPLVAPKVQPVEQKTSIVSSDEATVIEVWADSRPFAQDGNKFQKWTATQLSDVWVDPDFVDAPIEDKLAEVDRRYAARTQPSQAQVLDGQGGGRRNTTKITLDKNQMAVAQMMWPALSETEAAAKYMKGLK